MSDEVKLQTMATTPVVGVGTPLTTTLTTATVASKDFITGGIIENQKFAPKQKIETKPKIEYKYNEGEFIKEIQAYIDATYSQHYSQNKYQATEFILDAGHGTGFNIGNMMKYTQRYGRKGDPKEWRKDLMKVIHYAIIQLHVHDTENKD